MTKKISNMKTVSGNNRSHAKNATKRTFKPNFQIITINGKKVRMSAREIRTLNKTISKSA